MSMLRDLPQRILTADVGRGESFLSASALRITLWKSVQEMFAHPEKSESEIARTVGNTMAEQHELEHLLLSLRTTSLFARAYEAHERWVGLPFTLHYEGRLWSGTIDLAFIVGDAWVVGSFLLDPMSAGPAQVVKEWEGNSTVPPRVCT